MIYEYLVIAAYFALVITIAFAFKRMAENSSSDYFRGGGRMLWWMVGGSAFMAQFSAWTFTGAAGKAFTDGFAISFVFFANTFAYICAWLFFAKRFRQMRVDTPTEGIRRRYGKSNETFFAWALIVFGLIHGGLWLNALGVFASSFLQADLGFTIIATGLTILLVSVVTGAWGVVATDFIQTLVVVIIASACAIVALFKVGGPVNLVTEFPHDFVMGPNMNYGLLLFLSFVFFLPKQMTTMMNLNDSYRFLTAKDSHHASRAALFAAILMGFGSIVFFIPPWATAILYPDGISAFDTLGKKAGDAVFLIFAQNAMPAGTVGLLVAGLFAATMSSMDSSLNKASGIFVRSVYQPALAKRNITPSDKGLLRVGMLVSSTVGILVILSALYLQSLKQFSLFDLMMQTSVLIQVPLLVPLILGILIKRTPTWAPWATVALGMSVSWYMANIFSAQWIASFFGLAPFTAREASDVGLMATIGSHLVITAGFFVLTQLFYRSDKDAYREDTDSFFEDLNRPVVSESDFGDTDRQQYEKLGNMVLVMGGGLLVMMLIPNPLSGRLIFAACAAALLIIGFSLKRSAKSADRILNQGT